MTFNRWGQQASWRQLVHCTRVCPKKK